MILLYLAITWVFGLTAGYVLSKLIRDDIPSVGTLRIDKSDPDGPYLFLELETDPVVIEKQEYINLKVNVENYISQK